MSCMNVDQMQQMTRHTLSVYAPLEDGFGYTPFSLGSGAGAI